MAGTAPAAEIDRTASYVISLGGANVANVAVDLKDTGSTYSLDLKAEVSGMGQFVTSGNATADVSGRSTGSVLVPQEFSVETKTRDQTFSADVQYQGGDVTSFRVSPPILDNYDRVPIERSQLNGVGDMLSAFVVKGNGLDAGVCNRHLAVFTGIERFDIGMQFKARDVATSLRTGYQGPVVLCTMKYTPISGHYTNSEITNYLAQSDKLLIWYAPLDQTGYFIPYRVLIGTAVGDLSMVLTATSGGTRTAASTQ